MTQSGLPDSTIKPHPTAWDALRSRRPQEDRGRVIQAAISPLPPMFERLAAQPILPARERLSHAGLAIACR